MLGEVDEDRQYCIVVECYDHTAPVRGPTAASFASSPLVPTTRTRLPPALDADLRATQHRLVLPQSNGPFWETKLPATRALDTRTPSTLSAAGTTLLEAPSPTLEQRRSPSPRIWSESFGLPSPPAIATADLWTPSKGAAPQLSFGAVQHKAVVDFRFGPLAIDSIDYPEPRGNPAPLMSPRAVAATLPATGGGGSGKPISSNPSRSVSSSPPPLSRPRPPETSGSTDLYWGMLHLYREAGASESTPEEKRKARDEDDGRTVGLISVPGVLNAAALLSFIAPALEDVEQVRMLRDSTPSRSLVLVRFRDASSASEFRRMYNGKPYHDSKDSEVCHVVRISSIKLKTTTTPPFTYPFSSALEPTSPGSDPVELPTCPVCLELLDSRVTGLVQIMCQHSYHCQCLLKWGDSRCPVCRSTNARQRRNTVTSETSDAKCSTCQSPSNLWICVICGNVGCGRYQGGHAHSHYTETGHSFSLEIETGRIWSYLDDEYVHRLIRLRGNSGSNGGARRNGDGDRLIELPSRAGRPSPGGTAAHHTTAAHHRSNNDDPEDLADKIASSYGGPDRDAETEQDKLEALALEYGTLMTSQLASQREWFEEEVARERERVKLGEKVRDGLELELDQVRSEVKRLGADRKRAEAEWAAERQRLRTELDAVKKEAQGAADERRKERAEQQRVRKSLEAELASERAVTASLSSNLASLRDDFRTEQDATAAVRREVDDLKDQLNDMMAALSMRDRIEREGPDSEWAGASVGLAAPPPSSGSAGQTGTSPSAAKAAQRKKKKKK
ncbi:hypothetical protein JCM3774_004790 [Rhodotorula dairenensis]